MRISLTLASLALACVSFQVSAADAICAPASYENTSEEKIASFPFKETASKLAAHFEFPCMAYVNAAHTSMQFEFTRPGEQVEKWKNLMTIHLFVAPQGQTTTSMLVGGLEQNIKQVGGTFTSHDSDKGWACFDYKLTSPKIGSIPAGDEYAAGCFLRVSTANILLIQKQARTAMSAEETKTFLKNLRTYLKE